MPIATAEVYAQMLDAAKQQGFAYPAINVTSSQTLNAALKGFADAGSDGIVQISTGGAEYLSGAGVKDMVTGAVALAEFAHVVADRYPVHIGLHTDHCPKNKLDGYMRPLIAISRERVERGQEPLSSRTCGTARPCRWPRTSRSPPNCCRSARPPAS
jgi:fructose-bisphosphate aldolase, class II